MATVDVIKDLRKGCRCLYIAVEASVADDMTKRAEALIRRVERYEKALENCEAKATLAAEMSSGGYIEAFELIANLACEALKESDNGDR